MKTNADRKLFILSTPNLQAFMDQRDLFSHYSLLKKVKICHHRPLTYTGCHSLCPFSTDRSNSLHNQKVPVIVLFYCKRTSRQLPWPRPGPKHCLVSIIPVTVYLPSFTPEPAPTWFPSSPPHQNCSYQSLQLPPRCQVRQTLFCLPCSQCLSNM